MKTDGDRHSRGGRPTREREGDVDRRLLDAASELFVELGFERTSCEQVAARARASKASLYARYPDKEALFTDVVRRMAERTVLPAPRVDPALPLHDRVTAAATTILHRAMRPDAVALARMMIAEAPRMPALVRELDGLRRKADVDAVLQAIVGAEPGEGHPHARAVAERFADLVFVPHQMRALLGDGPARLKKAVPARIALAIESIDALRSR